MPNRTTVAARHNGIAKTYFLISENSQSVPKCMYTFRNMKADVTNLGHYVGNYFSCSVLRIRKRHHDLYGIIAV